MEIFDDLVKELKEEQLLEETVIEEIGKSDDKKSVESETSDRTNISINKESDPDINLKSKPHSPNKKSENLSKAEFFCKRAVKEVAFLQMVEVVLSGVEREQMKVVSMPFDDLRVKKLLHEFVQVSKENDLEKQTSLEFQLLKETENWYTSLSNRDKSITIGHLRRFCETTRPALSSSALVSLSKFYRNSPFSEHIRNKFDLIITRVFSKDVGSEKREFIFTRQELIDHVTGLYTEWESVPMYSTRADDPEILAIVANFEEFISEAEKADSFDILVKSTYFDRLRKFKKSTNENFYAPMVVAAAVECNIRVGNSYVDLIEKERERVNSQKLDEKYGLIIDKVVSDVTSKTLQLVDILEEKDAHPGRKSRKNNEKKKTKSFAKSPNFEKLTAKIKENNFLKVNKWLLILAGILFVIAIGVYSFVDFSEPVSETSSSNVVILNLKGNELEKYLKAPRVSNGVLYAVVNDNWNGLKKTEKEKILNKTVAFSKKEDISKVHLFNKEGKTVGAAEGEKVFVRDVE